MKILYSTQATSTGGREGRSLTADGVLAVALSTPRALGGAGGPGTNPEQLLAAGYSACFLGALKYVAGKAGVRLPADTTVTAQVGIGARDDQQGFGIEIALAINAAGIERPKLEQLVAQAHMVCPYSHATRNNIPVTLQIG
jgi:osmotically inducible protein OsmC